MILVVLTALIFFIIIRQKDSLIQIFKGSFLEYILLFLLGLIIIWNQIYNRSLDSDQSWTYKLHSMAFPLTGNNAKIIPLGTEGYLFDSTCYAQTVNGDSYFEANLSPIKVFDGDTLSASVYCFVSKSFNGDSVQISVKGTFCQNQITYYKLFDSKSNNLIPTYNLFSNGDFKLGTENWIPNADSTTHALIKTPFGPGIRVSRTNGDGGWWSLRYSGRPIVYYTGHRYQIKFIFKIEKGNGIPFNIGWWVNENDGFAGSRLPLEIKSLENGWKEAICSYKFKNTYYDLPAFLNSLQSNTVVDITNVELKDLDRNDTIPSYDDQLNKKGTWQKLTVKAPCNHGKAIISLKILKNNETDFKSLNGYVIFTKPQYEILN